MYNIKGEILLFFFRICHRGQLSGRKWTECEYLPAEAIRFRQSLPLQRW